MPIPAANRAIANRIIELIVNHESTPDIHVRGSLWANLIFLDMLNETGIQGAKDFLQLLEAIITLPPEKRIIQ